MARITILSALQTIAQIIGAPAPSTSQDHVTVEKDVAGGLFTVEVKARLERQGNSGYSTIRCSVAIPSSGTINAAEARAVAILVTRAADLLAEAEAYACRLRWSLTEVEAEAKADAVEAERIAAEARANLAGG